MEYSKCLQCSKPAMYQVGEQNIPLCLDCYLKVFQIQQTQIENAERQINYYSDEIDYQLGFPPSGPRFPQRRTIHVGGMTLNNIKIDNSTIGSINTGTIGSLDIAITSVKQNDPKVAEALTQLSQAVISNQALTETSKNEILEILSALASELATPKELQKISVAKTLITRLSELITVAQGLHILWQQWGPTIKAAFGA